MYKNLTTPPDYKILHEELNIKSTMMKYQTEDAFWTEESKDWDGILDEYYVNVTGREFREYDHTQNVKYVILRIKYYYNGHIYTAISK